MACVLFLFCEEIRTSVSTWSPAQSTQNQTPRLPHVDPQPIILSFNTLSFHILFCIRRPGSMYELCAYKCCVGSCLIVYIEKKKNKQRQFLIPNVRQECALRHPNRLDDLEDCRAADDEYEERQQPRTDRVLVLFRFLRTVQTRHGTRKMGINIRCVLFGFGCI